jgi:hypothetical protein
VIAWLRGLFGGQEPLVRGPGAGRPRTYSADSGYVYVYAFAGFRKARNAGENTFEYVFDVSTGRAPSVALTVRLRESILADVVPRESGLSASERYGVAKVALKRALDRFDHPGTVPSAIVPDAAELREIAEMLDL